MTLRPGSGQAERLAFSLGGRRDIGSRARTADPPPPETPAAPAASSAEPTDWAFTWTLVFTAVLFLRPQDIFPPLGALHLAELSAMGALISLLGSRLAQRQALTRMTPEFAGVLALGVVILVTAPFSIWTGGAIGTFQDLYLKVILVYLLTVNVLVSPKRLERLTWLLVLALGYLAFRAVFDYARGVNLLRGGTRVRGSVGGILENPNDLALNMVVFIPLAAFMAMQPGPVLKRMIAAGCAVFMVGAVVASGSRGGFLGFATMLVVLAAFAARTRPGVVVAGVMVLMCALPLAPASYWQRIASITDESKDDHQSSQARRTLIRESWDAFVQNPVTGVGAGQFKAWNPEGRAEAWHEAHNVWLQVAAELGIFGVAAFLFLVMRAFQAVFQTRRLLRRVRRASRRTRGAAQARSSTAEPSDAIPAAEMQMLDAHSAAMVASIAGWFVCALFASVAYNWTFYYVLALAAAPREILRDLLPASAARATSAGTYARAARVRSVFAPNSVRVSARKVRA